MLEREYTACSKKAASAWEFESPSALQISARGGTGTRTALRTQRAQALWRFESLRADQVRADAGTGIQAALRAPCASVRVRVPVGTPKSARVVKLAATAVLNTAAFGRRSCPERSERVRPLPSPPDHREGWTSWQSHQ